MQTVILVAGKATRLEPLTKTMSKVMVPLANKPMLAWTLEKVQTVSDEIFLVVRRDQEDVISYFSQICGCRFVFQDEQHGTAHALAQLEPFITGQFLLLYGDGLVSQEDITALATVSSPVLSGFETDHPEQYGQLQIEHNRVVAIVEKPEKPLSNLINAGVYVLDKRIFDYIKKTNKSLRGEYELTDSLMLLARDVPLQCYRLKKWMAVTFAWDILDANRFILDEIGSKISPRAEIRPGAYIEEPVAIADGAIIGPNCYIRQYSSIGKNCKVGNAVEIKNSIVMDHSFVSHLSYVGDSIVGRNCNIAAGTIFANLRLDDKTIKTKIKGHIIDSGRRKLGGIVGDNVKFGVNCTIMPGKKIWNNILIPPCISITHDIETQDDAKSGD